MRVSRQGEDRCPDREIKTREGTSGLKLHSRVKLIRVPFKGFGFVRAKKWSGYGALTVLTSLDIISNTAQSGDELMTCRKPKKSLFSSNTWGIAAVSSVGASVALFFTAIKPGEGPSFYPDWYCLAGLPVSSENVTVLINRGYLVGYNERDANPSWVCYRVEQTQNQYAPERPSSFKTDKRTNARVSSDDYTNTGYDRGHMAPSFAIGLCHGEEAQKETFLMSNVVPQKPDMNRGPWKVLEKRVVELAQREFLVWVTTGPVYTEFKYKSVLGVQMPDAFFKILSWNETNSIAFLIEQDAKTSEPLDYKTTVDHIESITGFDFMAGLPDDIENSMESQISLMVSE